MGFLDFFIADPAFHVKKAFVKSWIATLLPPDPNDIIELPFTDPNYYDLIEQEDEDAQEPDQENLETSQDNQLRVATTHISLVTPSVNTDPSIRYRPMSDGSYNYPTVAYSSWNNVSFSSRYAVGGYGAQEEDDAPYSRALPVIRRSVFSHPEIEEETASESEEESEEGTSEVTRDSLCNIVSELVTNKHTGSELVTSSSSAVSSHSKRPSSAKGSEHSLTDRTGALGRPSIAIRKRQQGLTWVRRRSSAGSTRRTTHQRRITSITISIRSYKK